MNNIGLRVALDCDGVICNFGKGVVKRAKELKIEFLESEKDWPHWDGHENFSMIMKGAWTDPEFWLELEPLNSVSFTPHCYITSRQVPSEITEEWLMKNGFPKAKVITVKRPEEKLEHLKAEGVDLLIDDLHTTVRSAIDAGIKAFLFDAPYQRGHAEECKGLPKLYSLEDLNKILC